MFFIHSLSHWQVSLIINRVSQFVYKLNFALTVLITSWTENKQRRQSAGTLLALNAALCPLLLAVVVLSALLSAPLLPLFTLPVFLVGFPRPLRSWPGTPGTACPCPDSVYYQQLCKRLASAIRPALANGTFGELHHIPKILIKVKITCVTWIFKCLKTRFKNLLTVW